jgi:hypothetical protein
MELSENQREIDLRGSQLYSVVLRDQILMSQMPQNN